MKYFYWNEMHAHIPYSLWWSLAVTNNYVNDYVAEVTKNLLLPAWAY